MALAFLPSQSAQAQTSNQAAAESLFSEARALLKAKRYAEACAKLVASQRLDPGVGTLLNLALCYEQGGQTASAWATYREAAAAAKAAGQLPRSQAARHAADVLEPSLSKLIVSVSPEAARLHPTVQRDSVLIPEEGWGALVAVDPGEHTIQVSAPGRITWSKVVRVAPKESSSVVVPELDSATQAATVPSQVASPSTVASVETPEAATGGSSNSSAKTAAITLGVIGIAGGTIAVWQGLTFDKKKDESVEACPTGKCVEPNFGQSMKLREDATQARTLAFISGAIGGASLIVGGVLWFTSPKKPVTSTGWNISPGIGPGVVGIDVRSTW